MVKVKVTKGSKGKPISKKAAKASKKAGTKVVHKPKTKVKIPKKTAKKTLSTSKTPKATSKPVKGKPAKTSSQAKAKTVRKPEGSKKGSKKLRQLLVLRINRNAKPLVRRKVKKSTEDEVASPMVNKIDVAKQEDTAESDKDSSIDNDEGG